MKQLALHESQKELRLFDLPKVRMMFWVILGTLIMGLSITSVALYLDDYEFSFTPEGIDSFLKTFQIFAYVISIEFIVLGLIVANHRSEQNLTSNQLSKEQNKIKLWNEFFEIAKAQTKSIQTYYETLAKTKAFHVPPPAYLEERYDNTIGSLYPDMFRATEVIPNTHATKFITRAWLYSYLALERHVEGDYELSIQLVDDAFDAIRSSHYFYTPFFSVSPSKDLKITEQSEEVSVQYLNLLLFEILRYAPALCLLSLTDSRLPNLGQFKTFIKHYSQCQHNDKVSRKSGLLLIEISLPPVSQLLGAINYDSKEQFFDVLSKSSSISRKKTENNEG